MSRKGKFASCLSAKAANGWGTSVNVDEYQEIGVQIATANSCDATIQCWGSMSATEPTWANAAAVNNIKAPVRMISLDDNSSVTGSTGISPGGTDIIEEYRINVSNIRFINFQVSSYVAGNITVNIRPINQTRNA